LQELKIMTEKTELFNTQASERTALGLWYHERHLGEMEFGLHVQKVLHSEQTDFQRLDVLETTAFGRLMTLDGLVMVTERDEFVYHELIAHVPLLAHPNPRDVLVIGGGDGGTLREVLRHDCVQRAVLCEIDGAVVQAARTFFPDLAVGLDDPRADVQIADGVAYVKEAASASFDLVIVDSTDPIGPGVGLFSEDFYQHVSRILRPDGLVIAQCESPWQRNVNFRKVYGNLHCVSSSVFALVGSIPTYPFGFWSWGVASKSHNPAAIADAARYRKLEPALRYYNADIHAAVFALPNFFRRQLQGVVKNASESI
jgi:spermidine synthase